MDVDETVRALFAAFTARDVAAAVEITTADVTFHPQGTLEEVGRAAPYQGADGVRRYFEDVDRAWAQLVIETASTRIAGQGAIVFGRARGTTMSGREVDVPVIWVMKLRDGKIASVRAVSTAEEAQRVAGRA